MPASSEQQSLRARPSSSIGIASSLRLVSSRYFSSACSFTSSSSICERFSCAACAAARNCFRSLHPERRDARARRLPGRRAPRRCGRDARCFRSERRRAGRARCCRTSRCARSTPSRSISAATVARRLAISRSCASSRACAAFSARWRSSKPGQIRAQRGVLFGDRVPRAACSSSKSARDCSSTCS